MLGAGNTHRDGPHAAAVESGIRFLVGRQRADGSLAGDAEFFAALYCHGMATIAVAECLAMTGDESLRPAAASQAVPEAYADRLGSRRAAAAAARGGSQETERAVQSALAWLAAAQSGDGRWNAARHGGGVERAVQGHHRQGAGAKSDHGVTGLALLAMLGAGNTHREGVCAGHVDRGIRFLVDRQRADGSLAGDAEFFAALYCHGMATIALAECCAIVAMPWQ